MQIQDLFSNFEHSAFRLEGLPEYRVADEADALEVFRRTQSPPPGFNADWGDLVQKNISAGKTMSRLRLFSDPLTDYEKFEIRGYEAGLAAGESIRVASRKVLPYEFDFWAFDDKWIARMDYGSNGEWFGADVSEMTDIDRELVNQWLRVYESASLIHELHP